MNKDVNKGSFIARNVSATEKVLHKAIDIDVT